MRKTFKTDKREDLSDLPKKDILKIVGRLNRIIKLDPTITAVDFRYVGDTITEIESTGWNYYLKSNRGCTLEAAHVGLVFSIATQDKIFITKNPDFIDIFKYHDLRDTKGLVKKLAALPLFALDDTAKANLTGTELDRRATQLQTQRSNFLREIATVSALCNCMTDFAPLPVKLASDPTRPQGRNTTPPPAPRS